MASAGSVVSKCPRADPPKVREVSGPAASAIVTRRAETARRARRRRGAVERGRALARDAQAF